MRHINSGAVSLLTLATVLFLAGCHKKVTQTAPPPPPPPVPAPVEPTATLTASPTSIQQGQSTELTWQTENATDIAIDALGTVPAYGSRTVNPGESITYQLVAKGSGGTATASTRLTVTPPPTPVAQPSLADLFAQNVKDILFSFDESDIRADQQQIAQSDGQFLAAHPKIKVVIEGHCDDRGSIEYNLGLGDNRAQSMKNQFIQAGVNADNIHVISYGKEKPFCSEESEPCWQENRRAHLVFQQ